MRVMAASFPNDASAREARTRLLAELEIEAHEVGVEALAQPANPGGPAAILAGKFNEDVVPAAREVVERLGGTVMIDIDAAETNA
jgi:hypothetical protein